MALIKCTECGREVSDRAAACPGCGAPPKSTVTTQGAAGTGKGTSRTQALLIVGAIVAVPVVWALFFDKPKSQEEIAAREQRITDGMRVEQCEDRYEEMNKDRQYTPDVLRIHSMACRKLREDYKAKWGRDP